MRLIICHLPCTISKNFCLTYSNSARRFGRLPSFFMDSCLFISRPCCLCYSTLHHDLHDSQIISIHYNLKLGLLQYLPPYSLPYHTVTNFISLIYTFTYVPSILLPTHPLIWFLICLFLSMSAFKISTFTFFALIVSFKLRHKDS